MHSKINVSNEANKSAIKKLKILIVEDDINSYRLLDVAVKELSSELLWAKTGKKAVDICKNNDDIDLILLDIKLPLMDGYEALKEIRQFNKDVIIIAQTAYAMLGDREFALKAGCDDYLSKPIKHNELIQMIYKYAIAKKS